MTDEFSQNAEQAPAEQNPGRKPPNLLLLIILALALPFIGVFVMQTVRRVLPLLADSTTASASGEPSKKEAQIRPAPPEPNPAPVVSPLAPPAPAPSPELTAPPSPALEPGPIAAGETSGAPAAESETQLVQQEVLKRIDLMPNLSAAEQDKLYVQVERARRMVCVARLAFAPGGRQASKAQLDKVKTLLNSPENQLILADPTTVIVVLGFADKRGDDATNLRISLERADNVRIALRDQMGIQNVMHSVGMGSSDLFDANNFDKNRLVEVWIVVP